ncbi:unnamed protein product, partial [Didymodactylos carnosus]
KTYYKQRQRLYPSAPKEPTFKIPEEFTKSYGDEPFILYDGFKKKYLGRLLIFSTATLLNVLFTSELINSDGTFKIRPILFDQVFVILGMINGEGVPLVWALTSCRLEGVYEKMWKVLRAYAVQKNITFAAKRFITDFERANINAIENHFPQSEINGCWFHLCKALYQHIAILGLIPEYDEDGDVRMWLRSFMALPLVHCDTNAN